MKIMLKMGKCSNSKAVGLLRKCESVALYSFIDVQDDWIHWYVALQFSLYFQIRKFHLHSWRTCSFSFKVWRKWGSHFIPKCLIYMTVKDMKWLHLFFFFTIGTFVIRITFLTCIYSILFCSFLKENQFSEQKKFSFGRATLCWHEILKWNACFCPLWFPQGGEEDFENVYVQCVRCCKAFLGHNS